MRTSGTRVLAYGRARGEVVGDDRVVRRGRAGRRHRLARARSACRARGCRGAPRREACESIVEVGARVAGHGAQSSSQFHTPLSSSSGWWQFGGTDGIGLPGGQSRGTPGGRVVVVTGGIVEVVVVGAIVVGGSVGTVGLGSVVVVEVEVEVGAGRRPGARATRKVVEVVVLR